MPIIQPKNKYVDNEVIPKITANVDAGANNDNMLNQDYSYPSTLNHLVSSSPMEDFNTNNNTYGLAGEVEQEKPEYNNQMNPDYLQGNQFSYDNESTPNNQLGYNHNIMPDYIKKIPTQTYKDRLLEIENKIKNKLYQTQWANDFNSQDQEIIENNDTFHTDKMAILQHPDGQVKKAQATGHNNSAQYGILADKTNGKNDVSMQRTSNSGNTQKINYNKDQGWGVDFINQITPNLQSNINLNSKNPNFSTEYKKNGYSATGKIEPKEKKISTEVAKNFDFGKLVTGIELQNGKPNTSIQFKMNKENVNKLKKKLGITKKNIDLYQH